MKVLIPTREDWCMPGKIANPNVDIWYMDRSGISIHFDPGVHGPRDNHREINPMGSLSTVLQAEMMVILRCSQILLSKNITRRRIHICFGSRAAIAAFAKTTTESALLWENMQVLEKLCGSNKVTLLQVPGHNRIQGNEEADKLAKEGTNGVPSDKTVGIPFVVGKE